MEYIHDNICSLEGSSFMTDYESAMRNAIADQYPGMKIRCCWFHFCQAVKRRASSHAGFVHFIRNNLLEREVYYKLMCLPLLPPDMILTGFDILKKKAERIKFKPFHDFMHYYERQWMIRVCIYFDFPYIRYLNLIVELFVLFSHS